MVAFGLSSLNPSEIDFPYFFVDTLRSRTETGCQIGNSILQFHSKIPQYVLLNATALTLIIHLNTLNRDPIK